jgi:hypothetical protein
MGSGERVLNGMGLPKRKLAAAGTETKGCHGRTG